VPLSSPTTENRFWRAASHSTPARKRATSRKGIQGRKPCRARRAPRTSLPGDQNRFPAQLRHRLNTGVGSAEAEVDQMSPPLPMPFMPLPDHLRGRGCRDGCRGARPSAAMRVDARQALPQPNSRPVHSEKWERPVVWSFTTKPIEQPCPLLRQQPQQGRRDLFHRIARLSIHVSISSVRGGSIGGSGLIDISKPLAFKSRQSIHLGLSIQWLRVRVPSASLMKLVDRRCQRAFFVHKTRVFGVEGDSCSHPLSREDTPAIDCEWRFWTASGARFGASSRARGRLGRALTALATSKSRGSV